MEYNIFIVLSNIDDYLDISIGSNIEPKFKEISDLKQDLKNRSLYLTDEEYHKDDSEIFYKYLKLKGVI